MDAKQYIHVFVCVYVSARVCVCAEQQWIPPPFIKIA